jgi:hypothetical protein
MEKLGYKYWRIVKQRVIHQHSRSLYHDFENCRGGNPIYEPGPS